ncbi:MAG: J domain-containing protein [Acidobacteria bacterium]|nr:J domain-containing protein [Acidobacteriota bacterium]
MPGKTHYEALEVAHDASSDDIRHAFRQAIARYHPDKVQHLGKEFQQLAAERSAELTEAYRTLMDPDKRSEYDRTLASERDRLQAATMPAPSVEEPGSHGSSPGPPPPTVERSPDPPTPVIGFDAERANRDALIGRAALARLRHAFVAEFGKFDEPDAAGFDVSCSVKAKLFSRSAAPLFVGRFVPRLDGAAVAQTFTAAPTAVFLVPIDVRDWQALLLPDAPPAARAVVQRLQAGK